MVDKVVRCSDCPFQDFCKVRKEAIAFSKWWQGTEVNTSNCPLAKLVINEIL